MPVFTGITILLAQRPFPPNSDMFEKDRTIAHSIEINASPDTVWQHVTEVDIASFRHPTYFTILSIPKPLDESGSLTTYIYNFTASPRILAPLLEPIMNVMLKREVANRLRALRDFLKNSPTLL